MYPCLWHYANPLLNPGRDPVYGGYESTRNQIWCHSSRMRALPSVQRLKDLHISVYRTGGTISLTMEALLDSSSVVRASEACRRQPPADTSSDRVPNCGSTHDRHGSSTRTMSSPKEGGGHRIGNRSCPGERYWGHVPRPRVDATATERTGRASRTAYAEPGDRSAPHARGAARSLEVNPNSEPIQELAIHRQGVGGVKRLSMMRIMARRTKATTVLA